MRVKFLSAVVVLATLCFAAERAAAAILIGDGVRNGYFSDTTVVDAGPNAAVTNSSGRALEQSPNVHSFIEIPGWRAVREEYSGGNNAFGWDAAAGRTVGDVPYAFTNATTINFISGAVPGVYTAGDTFDLDFGTYTTNAGTHTVQATLDFDSGETFTFPAFTAGANEGDTALFSDSYTLLASSSSVTLTLRMGDPSESNGQFTLDNVLLQGDLQVPEPVSFAYALLGLVGLGLTRRRSQR